VELGEKAFAALGERQVCVSVQARRLEGEELRLENPLALAQR
jgi:hypothetical protein